MDQAWHFARVRNSVRPDRTKCENAMKLEQLIVERGLVAPETLARARLVQAETGERLDSVLTRLGMVAEQALAGAIAAETGFPIAATDDFPQEPVLPEAISVRFLRDIKAVPLAEQD